MEAEPSVAADLAGQIRWRGYGIAGIAATGEQAIALTRQLRPALVLLDFHLAGARDGFAAATAIQREQAVPRLFLTATGGNRVIEAVHH